VGGFQLNGIVSEPSSTDIVNANYGLITAAAQPWRIQISARLSF
jgi:hypothetical protein